MKRMSMTYLKPVLFVLILSGMLFAAGEPAPPSEPILEGDEVPHPTFGDARNVKLFDELLDDEDVRVRERAAAELGQTHNPAALVPLRKAAQDPSPAVRTAAARGAAELGPVGKDVIFDLLQDEDDAPLLAAMEAVVALNFRDVTPRVQSLTRHKREIIRYSALRTLTALQQPVKAADMKRLLEDPSPAVRVEALQNALLLKSAKDLKNEFIRLAGKSQPVVVRAAAVECLGAFLLNPTSPTPTTQPTTAEAKPRPKPWVALEDYAKIAKEKNPLLRRAVVRIYQRHRLPENILPFLSDPSPLVRLAAVRAMLNLPKPEAVEPLVKLFLSAPDDETHNTARTALQNIGGAPVGRAIAEQLPRIMADTKTSNQAMEEIRKKIDALSKQLEDAESKKKKADDKLTQELSVQRGNMDSLQRQQEQFQRNAISCCYLLGILERKEGFDELLRLSTSLSIDSPILGELAVALGRIRDPRAIAPLQKVLAECSKKALPYLKAMTTMATPPPFSEKVTGQVIQALVALGDKSSTDAILRLTRLHVMTMRLGTVISYVLDITPKLTTEENQKEIDKFLLSCLLDKNLSSLVQWKAIRLAGKLKFSRALPVLKKILYQDRECTSLMTIAAWAIQQITGSDKPPKIPQPVLRQGDWIITQIE